MRVLMSVGARARVCGCNGVAGWGIQWSEISHLDCLCYLVTVE